MTPPRAMDLDELRLRNDRLMVGAVLALLIVPFAWFVRTDLMLYAHDAPHLEARLLVRLALISVCVSGLVAMRWVDARPVYRRLAFVIANGIAAAMVAVNGLRPAGGSLPLRSPLLIIAAMYGGLPNSFWFQVTPPALLSVALVVLRLTWLDGTAESDLGGDILIVLVFNVLGVLLVRRRLAQERDVRRAWAAERDARQASERHLEELSVLRGIIPICSHCHKVRSEIGDWQRIERYVREHSEAEFTHGICPDCERLHYPDLGDSP